MLICTVQYTVYCIPLTDIFWYGPVDKVRVGRSQERIESIRLITCKFSDRFGSNKHLSDYVDGFLDKK